MHKGRKGAGFDSWAGVVRKMRSKYWRADLESGETWRLRFVSKGGKAGFWVWRLRILGGSTVSARSLRELGTNSQALWATGEISIFKSLQHCGDWDKGNFARHLAARYTTVH